MSQTPGHPFSEATKMHFEAQLELLNALTQEIFDGMEKALQLNMRTAQDLLKHRNDATKNLMAAKDGQNAATAFAAHTRPWVDTAFRHQEEALHLATDVYGRFSKTAQAHMIENTRYMNQCIDNACKNSHPGSEAMAAVLKSTLGSVNTGMDQLAKTGRQALETAQNTLQAMAPSASAEKAAKK